MTKFEIFVSNMQLNYLGRNLLEVLSGLCCLAKHQYTGFVCFTGSRPFKKICGN